MDALDGDCIFWVDRVLEPWRHVKYVYGDVDVIFNDGDVDRSVVPPVVGALGLSALVSNRRSMDAIVRWVHRGTRVMFGVYVGVWMRRTMFATYIRGGRCVGGRAPTLRSTSVLRPSRARSVHEGGVGHIKRRTTERSFIVVSVNGP